MASKAVVASTALLLSFNLLFFTMVSSTLLPVPSPPPVPVPMPSPAPSAITTCPIDALKFGVCANLLSGLLNITLGLPPKQPCCSLIQGVADLEAALCLCTAIRANILGINLNATLSVSVLLNECGNGVPRGFQCP
ncbi:hypothetical protein FNV43_RR08997 [Rhamnella rubrinervis]|uniref:Bifunctional inhibitor/plant lipid transfer protein/seed storage helical domain-containing protein n=1 Tax=Rhamnella rubrinervis TaxID=2594499 RepID=A0A8K0H9U9_9ROSA|nr:hypothetical protein FNV43_RR08997 [Rhamnella rubrinervis]